MHQLGAYFLDDESGATAIEYSFIALLISVACIAAWSLTGGAVDEAFRRIADNFRD